MTFQRRTIGIVAALVLALLGTLGLVGYVQGAKNRAVAGEKQVRVYVVTNRITAGTPASSIADMVEAEKVPAKVRASDAVTNLKSLGSEVASIDLLPGEQIVTSRFSASSTTDRVAGVPAGFFGATVALDPEQALGGQVRAGDRVAVVAMTNASGQDAATLVASNVLVTSVQIDGNNGDNPKKKEITAAPKGKFFVTLALAQPDLEKVVASTTAGVWLATDPNPGAGQ